MIVNMLTGL